MIFSDILHRILYIYRNLNTRVIEDEYLTMYILTAIAYYLIILPISWLPFWFLYRLSDFIFFVLYYLIRFRKDIVVQNLTRSFPDPYIRTCLK